MRNFFSYIVSAIRGHCLAQIIALLRKEEVYSLVLIHPIDSSSTSIFQTALIIVFPNSGYVLEDCTQRVLKKAKKSWKMHSELGHAENLWNVCCRWVILMVTTTLSKLQKDFAVIYCFSQKHSEQSHWKPARCNTVTLYHSEWKTVNTATALQCSPFQ